MQKAQTQPKPAVPTEAAVLSKAVANAARLWGLSNEVLGKVIGVSGPTKRGSSIITSLTAGPASSKGM